MRSVRIVFFGPPGTGKGTQAARLAESRRLVTLSSGDVLRREIREGSEVGEQAAQFVRSGQLVPDDVITRVMLAAIDKLGDHRGFILDGFPRTEQQADALANGLTERGITLDAVIDLIVPTDVIVRRLAGRRVCKKCGATYNVEFLPPQKAGVCDRCGSEIVQRDDDREDVIATRLDTYRAQTEPLVAYYRERGLLHEIQADADAEIVQDRIEEVIGALA